MMTNQFCDSNEMVAENMDSSKRTYKRRQKISLIFGIGINGKQIVFDLDFFQSYVAMRSIFWINGQGHAIMFSDEELMDSVDKEKPLDHSLLSIDRAIEMMSAGNVDRAMLQFSFATGEKEQIPLSSPVKAAVLAARLGIHLNKHSCASGKKLLKIYEIDWEPLFVNNVPAASLCDDEKEKLEATWQQGTAIPMDTLDRIADMSGAFYLSPVMLAFRRKFITREFLADFIKELTEGIDMERLPDGWIANVLSTFSFYHALKVCCLKHGIFDEIYSYFDGLPWYISDLYDAQLVEMAIEYGIIPAKALHSLQHIKL